ncbi:MAG: reductive dehalogenase [Deltaproteobacteria bacterium]|nr:reductive dehalogenase [Deltaproteobacteria bacterium]
MAYKFPWSGKDSHRDDPYWDFFINTAPADRTNTVTELMRNAPAGNLFPTKAELHTPEITASHVKGMAQYFGAELIGVAKLDDLSPRPLAGEGKGEGNEYTFAVICAVHADYDPRTSPGIGGQMPVQNGLFITFVLSSWIRELGFRATVVRDANTDALAAKAGLGTLNGQGKLVSREFGEGVYVADAIYTDLPLAADG